MRAISPAACIVGSHRVFPSSPTPAPRVKSSDQYDGSSVTVYLDDWRQRARLGPVDDRWSHLVGDTDEELHRFALQLGMKRAWFQANERRPHQAHYDVPDRLRIRALELGAEPVSWRQLGRMMRLRRATGRTGGGPVD